MKQPRSAYENFCQGNGFHLSGLSYPHQRYTVLQHVFARDAPGLQHMGAYLADKDHRVSLDACTHPAGNGVWSVGCTIETPNAAPLVLGGPSMLRADAIDLAVLLESECATVRGTLGMGYECQDPALLSHMRRHVQARRLVVDKPYIVSGGNVVLDDTITDMAAYLNGVARDEAAFQRYIMIGRHDEAKKANYMSVMSNVPGVKQSFARRLIGHKNRYEVSFISSDGIYQWPQPLQFSAAVRLQMGIGGLFTNNAVDIQAQSAMPLHCRNWQHVPTDPDYPVVRNQHDNRSLN